MKYLIIFGTILIVARIYADNPICKENEHLVNPRECCLDPKLITNEIIEKCRVRVSHIYEPNSYETMITEETLQQNHMHNPDELEPHLSVKPKPIEHVRNKIQRYAIPNWSSNSFDYNEYGDSDEKLSVRDARSREHTSESKTESREYHKNGDDHHHIRHHCNHHKHHHRHHHRHNCRHRFEQHHELQFNKFSCFMECVFNETGIIENKTINMGNVHTYLTEELKLSNEFVPIVTDAFETCGKFVSDMRRKIKELPVMPMMPMIPLMPHSGYKNNLINSQKCKPWAGYLMMCIKAQTFINCPADNFRNDDTTCNNTREFMKSCPNQSLRIPYHFPHMEVRFPHH